MHLQRGIAVAAMLLVVAFVLPTWADNDKAQDPFAWTNGYSLILTGDLTEEQAQKTVDFITENGGQVAIVVSPRLLLGWANASLVGRNGILAVHSRPVPPGLMKGMNVDEVDHVTFFNQVVSGKWKADRAATYGPMDWSRPDTITRPGASMNELVGPENIALSYPGTSDFMVGKVKYNVFLVESNGAIDANTYSWTCADLSTTVSEIAAGLSFWSSKAATYGVPLSFSTTYNRPPASGCTGNVKVLEPYEPILHAGAGGGYDGDGLWVNVIMCNFGYCSGDKWTRVQAYNQATRTSSKTNWATSMFLVYNPVGAPTSFTNGYFGYSWVPNGPYAQLLFRANGWAITDIDRVTSHETGHLFGADDEYSSSGCSNCTTSDASSKNVVNGNCENCNAAPAACMMSHNATSLCGYTPGQIGWGLNIMSVVATNAGGYNPPIKSNWVVGQSGLIGYTLTLPGRLDECVTIRDRVYVQFPNNVTQTQVFETPCYMKTGHNWTGYFNMTIPANAASGEALIEVQVEAVYPSNYYYGIGIKGSARGKFFVLPSSGNAITSSPEPVSGTRPEAALQR